MEKTYTVKPEFMSAWIESVGELSIDEDELLRHAGRRHMTPLEILRQFDINPAYMAAAVALMDDEIREDIHRSGACESDAQFLRVYEQKHFDKYGEEFAI